MVAKLHAADPQTRVEIVAGIVWDVFTSFMEPTWFEFASLSHELVYSQGGDMAKSVPVNVVETLDSVFISGEGCLRFMHANDRRESSEPAGCCAWPEGF